MRKTLVIYKAHAYARLTGFKPELVKEVLIPFCKQNFYRFQKVPGETFGTTKWEVSHVFARFNSDKTELRFNASMIENLVNYMTARGYNKSRIVIEEEPEIVPVKKNHELLQAGIGPRNELQEEFVKFMVESLGLVTNNMGTGQGKTFCALYSSFLIGERILITALPRYVDIWVKAFGEFYKIAANEIMLADTCNVQDVHQAILKGADPKIIIIPLTKIDIYLKKMKEEPETTVNLDQVFNDLGCGVRIIDEAHESIYSVYQSLLYGNHKKTMILSATLKGDDEFINGIYNQIFPQKSYLRATEYTQYINVISYHFRMDMWKYKINTKGFGGYSHVKFEQGILKKPYVMEEYFKMLMGAYREYFTDHYREGMKSMWFFATTEMCEKFNEYFISQKPGADSIVFTAAISKKQPTAYREHDNVVTTPGSCGTGKDIPYLFTVFSPVAVSSSQRNDQMVGRTRPVDKWWSDLFPYFVYFTCRDEPKQLDYDKKRRGLFGRKAKKIDVIDSGFRI
ncbi:putative DNA helicase/terminase [Aeromonas phage D3]|uniref:Putative DNA helicase/terminase n=1 Tax=Aeromonas phage D3 TaxID=2593327 RepID=A0A514TVN7_9CAUD|nr:putative DNA helicase/terminase [Aeromonas phage D3]QDJ97064.1 putative DNA helicase/terminase [Aeromonas phage D3]QEP52370.1 ATP-dependent helicase [Aeromonas phage D9]